MRNLSLFAFHLSVVSLLLFTSLPIGAVNFYGEKLSTPDLMQTDPKAQLPFGGKPYCGPVAASNAFVWLARNGYLRLAPLATKPGFGPEAQGALAREIGEFMKTTAEQGTNPNSFLHGVEGYVRGKGYAIESLKYQGIRKVDTQYSTGKERADLNWIRQSLAGPAAVWIEIGWYQRQPGRGNTYIRKDGHYVTVVGYGKNTRGTETIVVHDPSVASGITPHDDYLEIKKLAPGTLIRGRKSPQHLEASTFQYINKGLSMRAGMDLAVIESAMALRLRKLP